MEFVDSRCRRAYVRTARRMQSETFIRRITDTAVQERVFARFVYSAELLSREKNI